jgi:hypothetical protein
MRTCVTHGPLRRVRRGASLALLAPLLAGCYQSVAPPIEPATLPHLAPQLDRRAVLLLTPSLSELRPRFDPDVLTSWRYEIGPAADSAIRLWAERSFARVEVRRLSEADAMRHFTTAQDGDSSDVFILPRLDGVPERAWARNDHLLLRLRVELRALRTNSIDTFSATPALPRAAFRSPTYRSGLAIRNIVTAMNEGFLVRRGGL